MRPISAALFVAMFLFCSHLGGSLYAYLDPGTGAIALQLLLGGVVAALAAGRLYWGKLKAVVLRKPLASQASSTDLK